MSCLLFLKSHKYNWQNVRPYEITVNLREEGLREYGLTFEEVAQAIRASSLNLPGGTVRTRKGEVLIRSNTQAYSAHDFEQLVLRTANQGARLKLGDVASVRDAFEEVESSSEFNGQPAALVRVFRVGDQSALEIAKVVKQYVSTTQHTMPIGVNLETWQDDASYLRGRLELLYRNGRAGLILVFAILALFLRFRLAIWVTFGIPVSFLGNPLAHARNGCFNQLDKSFCLHCRAGNCGGRCHRGGGKYLHASTTLRPRGFQHSEWGKRGSEASSVWYFDDSGGFLPAPSGGWKHRENTEIYSSYCDSNAFVFID